MKWLPPSPHREAILDENESPLIQFEDGGLMELDKIRYDPDQAFHHAEQPDVRMRGEYRATQYSDVCGAIDELKRVFAEEPHRIAQDRDHLDSLLEDALYAMRRMGLRHQAYFEFGQKVARLARQVLEMAEPSMEPAAQGAEELRRLWDADVECAQTQLERLNKLAEQIRDVGSQKENRLRQQKELAIQIYQAYEAIKGERNWSEEEAQTE